MIIEDEYRRIVAFLTKRPDSCLNRVPPMPESQLEHFKKKNFKSCCTHL